MIFRPLRLKKNEDRRLRAGHLWVFSNEIDVERTPLSVIEPGEAVEIQAHNGKVVGTGYANPRSLIAARLCSRDPEHPWSGSLIVHRLKVALALRERLFPTPHYRLVYGESDGLPGLVVDRYGDQLVAQFTTAGIERMQDEVIAALVKVVAPRGIWLRNDVGVRALEGLEPWTGVVHGSAEDDLEIIEDGLRFRVPRAAAQKTGWFYDQRDNRARLARWVKGARVLDVFSYAGGWGIRAAAAGASEVTCVDASADALAAVEASAALNGLAVATLRSDAFDALRGLREARRHFDVVIVDPPAFIKRRKDHKDGLQAYHRINQLAMQLLDRDGLLVTCSCSHHLEADELRGVVRHEARHLDRTAQIVEVGGQGADHPIHPAIPETAYLKCLYARVLPASF